MDSTKGVTTLCTTVDTYWTLEPGGSYVPCIVYERTAHHLTAPQMLELTIDHLVPFWCDPEFPVVDDNEVLVRWQVDESTRRTRLIVG